MDTDIRKIVPYRRRFYSFLRSSGTVCLQSVSVIHTLLSAFHPE